MIKSIVLERMETGVYPIFDDPGQETHYAFTHQGWEQHFNPPHRLALAVEIDTSLDDFESRMRAAVEQAQQLVEGIDIFPPDGTLIFALYDLARIPENTHFGHYHLAGMAYTPTPLEYAVDLEGSDPAELILAMCRGQHHPIAQASMDRQARAREERRLSWQILQAEQREKTSIAAIRALKLLRQHLTPKQRRELKRRQRIHVTAQNGELFRIYERGHQNVFRLVNGREVMQYCIVAGDIPTYDLMLAQKLLLETNFRFFDRVSNKWDVTRPGRPLVEETAAELLQLYTEEELLEADRLVIEPLDPEAAEPEMARAG